MASCKGNQVQFWNLDSTFTDSGFQELDCDSVSVQLGFRVSIAFWIPDSKAQDSRILDTGIPSMDET